MSKDPQGGGIFCLESPLETGGVARGAFLQQHRTSQVFFRGCPVGTKQPSGLQCPPPLLMPICATGSEKSPPQFPLTQTTRKRPQQLCSRQEAPNYPCDHLSQGISPPWPAAQRQKQEGMDSRCVLSLSPGVAAAMLPRPSAYRAHIPPMEQLHSSHFISLF